MKLRRAPLALLSMTVLALGLVAAPAARAASAAHETIAARACQLVALSYGDWQLLLPGRATFDGGTPRDDLGSVGGAPVPAGQPIPVWCGFAGNDGVSDNWGYVYGGPGNDSIGENWLVFRGGPGNDAVSPNQAYFDGGPGDDWVIANLTTFVNGTLVPATFVGGPGNDAVIGPDGPPNEGLFLGGPGNDRADWNAYKFVGGSGNDSVGVNDGTFLGGRGNDRVAVNNGFFDGGPGYDVVTENHGTCVNVEAGC